MVYLQDATWILRIRVIQAVFICLLVLLPGIALVSAQESDTPDEERPCKEERLQLEQTQRLLNASPQALKSRGYIKRFPFPAKDRLITGVAKQLVIPGALLFAGNFSLGFLSQQLNQAIPSEPIRRLAYPMLTLLWDQVLSPSRSLSDALSRGAPAIIDGALILATQNASWGGQLSSLFRTSSLLYSSYRVLEKDLLHELHKWQTYNTKPINLEGDNLPQGLALFLERGHPHPELGDTRLAIIIPLLEEHKLVPATAQTPISALNNLAAIVQNNGIRALYLYPSNNSETLELSTQACKSECSDDVNLIPLPTIRGSWWTTLASNYPAYGNTTPLQIFDPLSPALLEAIAGFYQADMTSVKHPLTVKSSQLLVRAQKRSGLSILSAKGHLNIWLVAGESGIVPGYRNPLPNISLQATETFRSSIRHLEKHVEEPVVPGWAHLPLQLARLFVLAKIQSWSWMQGVNTGIGLEARQIFQGIKRKWKHTFIPQHTDRMTITFNDGQSVTANLILSAQPQKKLIVLFHPTRGSSDDIANSGYFGLTKKRGMTESDIPDLPEGVTLKEPTRLGNYLNNHGYDVFCAEYRAYRKEGTAGKDYLYPDKRDQFYSDTVESFDAILAKGRELYGEDGYETVHVVGYSIGSCAASHLARVRKDKIRDVTLLAPFRKLTEIYRKFIYVPIPFVDFLLKFPMNNQIELEQTTVPVHILHGEDDRVISPVYSQEMASHLQQAFGDSHRVTHKTFPGLKHDGLLKDAELMDHMIKIFSGEI
ncbi:alpha/beta hydrolase [Sansalvadorimonas verongulae]|uniref:alpha/beta hydrolase n=1 Tax=Sansalvadorimonas verongulae TaxID=2172824 RepID=UPI0012BBD5C1|nr:alpha/beta fold hydrolase [Sansalvadorimonas verongulae]MTI15436.1 hypothetical protein [Sansalvadorimonas verongulae]